VDAVFWIDYGKANQPPGSFKMGPRDSRPFNAVHMEICANGVIGGGGPDDTEGEESEVWTDMDDDQGATAMGGSAGALGMEFTSPPVTAASDLRVLLPKRPQGNRRPLTTRRTRGCGGGTATSKLLPAAAAASSTGQPKPPDDASPGGGAAKDEAKTEQAGGSFFSLVGSLVPKDGERLVLRSMLQEEHIPAHGSIYKRSMTPGPGYYYNDGLDSWQESKVSSFGYRPPGIIEQASTMSRELPGPGEYREKAAFSDVKSKLGRFARAERFVSPIDSARKSSAVSDSVLEGLSARSKPCFQSSVLDAPLSARDSRRGPQYSFGKSRRPF